jgi:hypothetical protein
MKSAVVVIAVLAVFAVPAFAGMNPNVAIFLYTTSTGVGGTNHKASPAPGSNTSVYVCFDRFGAGGGMLGAQFALLEVPGPNYLSTTNQFAGVGGLTLGTPGEAPGCAMTTGLVVFPDANGIVVLARIRYETPEEGAPRGGYIDVIPYSAGDGPVVGDQNSAYDTWCVHSVAANGLSGHFGWDDTVPNDGDCTIVAVEPASWGSIKALYR